MKKLFSFLILAAGLLANPARAEDFITGLGEIPKMAGLQENEAASSFFDSPELRISIAYLQGSKIKREKFWQFYTASLAALGWELDREKDGTEKTFLREDEILTIEILTPEKSENEAFAASFSITPK